MFVMNMRAVLIGLLLGTATIFGSACQPHEVAAVRAYLESPSADCYEAVDKHFPAHSREWFKGIVWRESRNQPWAQNSGSSAAGCAQLLKMHGWRFNATGSSWDHRYNADANIKAAAHLYREAGRSPWS